MLPIPTDKWDEVIPEMRYLQMASALNMPVGSDTIEKCYAAHPEYFPEELERRRIWNSIPEEVKKACYNEDRELFDKAMEGFQREGLLALINNSEKQAEWDRRYKIYTDSVKHLDKKYFGPYGL